MVLAQEFNQKFIFDMAYDSYMSERQIQNTASQVLNAYVSNRDSRHPFQMHIFKSGAESKAVDHLIGLVPTLLRPTFPIEVHDRCFIDSFPKERLVYLTPDSKNFLSEDNPTDIYVVPGVIDKGHNGPITSARAKQLGIRTAWFPLNRYLALVRAQQGLPFNLILDILMDFKNTRDWPTALKHVPQRRLKQTRGVRAQLEPITGQIGSSKWGDNVQQLNEKRATVTGNREPFKIHSNFNNNDIENK